MFVRDFLAKTNIRQAVLYMRLHNNRIEDPLCTGKPDEQYTEKGWEERQISQFQDFVAELLSEPVPTQKNIRQIAPQRKNRRKQSDRIILGYRCPDVFVPGAEQIDIAVYEKTALVGWQEAIRKDMKLPDPDTLTDEEVLRLIEELRQQDGPDIENTPHGYAFEFVPWEKILEWEVDPANIALCGKSAFTAALLEEMSFNGLSREDQDNRRTELDEAIQESDRIKALPEEERNKHFVKADDIFTKLYAELGEEYKPPTAEEKEAERRQIYREMLHNRRLKGIFLGIHLGLQPDKTKENFNTNL